MMIAHRTDGPGTQGIVTDVGPAEPIRDAGLPEVCERTRVVPTLIGPPSVQPSPHAGIENSEMTGWDAAREAFLAHPDIHFVATYLRDVDEYIIVGGAPDAREDVRFSAEYSPENGVQYTVTQGVLDRVFPHRSATKYGDLDALFHAFTNPLGSLFADRGYTADDPRMGFLSRDQQSYPLALDRIATLFHSLDGPDLVYGRFPWANGGTGTHGGLSLLQSRATLILSGPGIKSGVIIDEPAALVDLAPTTLALLGSRTTSGQSTRGDFRDGLFLTRQDGRVLYEAFDDDSCEKPDRVVIVLFDGLQAIEINEQIVSETPAVELPNFKSLMQTGTVYRHGAVAGFPSYSAPGHTTVGTGAWPGHHGMIANSFYGRMEADLISPFDLLSDLPRFIQDPEAAQAMYDRLVTGSVENLAQAAHRGMGAYDAETGEGAFVAIINEITFPDSDFSTLSFFNGGIDKGLLEYRIADNLAMTQFDTLLNDADLPVPTILQMSFLATDAAGESDGPHSDLVRDVLLELDQRLGRIMAAYQARNALDGTVFILTSDHGMELQDPQRYVSASAVLRQAGIQTDFVQAGLVYLRSLDVTAVCADGTEQCVIQVREVSNGAVVADALVRCPELMLEARTDDMGQVEFAIPHEFTGLLSVSVEHVAFNPGQASVSIDGHSRRP